MTNSPPSNVNSEESLSENGRILSSGLDSLVLGLSIEWKDESFLNSLEDLRSAAAAEKTGMPGSIKAETDEWIFNVQPHGANGYRWLLNSPEYDVRILHGTRGMRPSAMIEVRSATLWARGAIEAVNRIVTLLTSAGAKVQKVSASRTDECVDILLPEEIWTLGLLSHAVTRAVDDAAYRHHGAFTGITIGKGIVQARVYDKPLEIVTKSQKTWMFDVWNLKEAPAGGRIVRVEFQLRREALTELGIDTVWDLLKHPKSLWAYCTEHWLKFQDSPELHHTQQKTLPWWKSVQHGFLGGQDAHPLIRAKIVNVKKVQISQQMIGQLTSLIAMESDGDITPGGEIAVKDHLPKVLEGAALIGMNPKKMYERVRRRVAKYVQGEEKFRDAERRRKAAGLPVIRKRDGNGKGGTA